MQQLLCYKTLLQWNSQTVPDNFKQKHNTKPTTWSKLTVLHGTLTLALMTEAGKVTETLIFNPQSRVPFIEPQQWHRIVSFSDDMQCQLAFYCTAEDYYSKKYDLTATHSEVVEAVKLIPAGKTLDLGCGGGRNALYLNLKGFEVTAWDKNAGGIDALNRIIASERLSHINVEVRNLNTHRFNGAYDFILSTVVLMFLDRQSIPQLIGDMQNSTISGGYNLIVAAMDMPDHLCTLPSSFTFTFKSQELVNYYQGWNIIKYNEDIGQLHQTDAQGKRITLRFATLVACKA
ncbi:SAM-dependent methyltransferase TehB [Candidatus Fukatsuia symbiotica]|uniref:SAM-dependent methyltransferase TehB n=1 Tax=Candidatus Fukatsuia TaxID=1927833 RepID=UPI000E716CB7|nr:SAM-dependent methyltransferase TehB [Candidatus Fukatsuia symbiotica]MEA9445553.1 SAM-dependent methyltransferase TehB [Candidatus Fukatsuia symbiotica]